MVLNFNTSHVTVYLHRIHTKKCLLCNFNTSHVTVYHYSVEICQAGRKISIHPMLRFIRYIPSNCSSSCEFQYIPCYGLSSCSFVMYPCNMYFNTSHVTVYLGQTRIIRLQDFYFNTSHVTVYRRNKETSCADVEYFNTSHVTVYQLLDFICSIET